MAHRPARGLSGWSLAAALVLGVCVPAAAQHHDRPDGRVLDADPRAATGPIAPLLEGLGSLHHPITTASPRAQTFFDQGLRLAYGFNHQEALRSFKEAARLDPQAAMAYWGWAWVLGPNLNLAMQEDAAPQVAEAMRLAIARRDGASARERDYIDALATRYAGGEAPADRGPLDAAYAEAMGRLHRAYPDDLDAATLYAESLMLLSPWDYFTGDGRPRDWTGEILKTLEEVARRDPAHTGALHLYTHAVEAVEPGRGEAAADRLRGLAPGAGHLVHMPSHIYMQTGRYREAYESNALAVKADEGYITQCRAQGIYPLAYYPHNIHFLVWAAIQQGRSAEAIDAARKVASRVPEDRGGDAWGLYQAFLGMPINTLARFGRWDEILQEPAPPGDAPFLAGLRHYARGLAFTHTGRPKEARRELDRLEALAADPGATRSPVGFSDAARLLDIAREALRGEIEAKAGRFDAAIARLDRAARLEDGLLYNEPPDWFLPVRHTLGAVLLEAGRPAEAEVVYWRDLEKRPENGFALHGLRLSLEAQGKADEAARVLERLRAAWAGADVRLTSSRF